MNEISELIFMYVTNCNFSENTVTFTYKILSPLHNNVDFLISCFNPDEVKVSHIIVQGIRFQVTLCYFSF